MPSLKTLKLQSFGWWKLGSWKVGMGYPNIPIWPSMGMHSHTLRSKQCCTIMDIKEKTTLCHMVDNCMVLCCPTPYRAGLANKYVTKQPYLIRLLWFSFINQLCTTSYAKCMVLFNWTAGLLANTDQRILILWQIGLTWWP